MLVKFVERLTLSCGLNYTLDPDLPDGYLLRVLFRCGIGLLWGFIRTGKKNFIAFSASVIGNPAFGCHVTIEQHATINAVAKTKVIFGNNTKIGAFSQVLCTTHLSQLGQGFSMGDYSACGEFCYFGATGSITIGKNVIMGQYVSFHSQEHEFGDLDKPIREQGTKEKGIFVHDNCWIGAKATLLDGTVIGRNCVIGAGSLVKGMFPDNAVIAGNPARIIRMRDGSDA